MTVLNTQKAPDIGIAPDLDSSSDEYAKRFSGEAGAWLLAVQSEITKQHIAKIGSQKICDIGGGHAQNVELAERMGISLTVVGSDSSCGSRVSRFKNSSTTEFVVSPLDKLVFDNASQPHVLSYRIVSHMVDWSGFIAELCRISSDAVTIDFASKRSINIFSELAYKLKRGQEGDTRRYNVLSESNVDKFFEEAGFFKDIRSPQFFFPMAIHRKLNLPRVSTLLEAAARLVGLTSLFGSPIIVTYRRAGR